MNKVERALFYPVTVVATIAALQAWSYQTVGVAVGCTLIALLLWLRPLFPTRLQVLSRVCLWVAMVGLVLGLGWIYLWSRQ